ncbi:MAG TPA: hypothetical protein PK878_10980 [bacterium]|nr:hypothetical protein [Candidatus Omnitrophota bacterium]HOJ60800.1 hypothetical protein [bacterium]HOL95373.1 hypothetical protein [bacterium]HPO99887.1 hypothetical protein [bacterium]HXK95228.1 hypothetical protein [bacterium]
MTKKKDLPKKTPSHGAPESPWKETRVPLQDVVLSNSWALQAILNYLDEIHPGARDRIWHHYEVMKQQAEAYKETLLPETNETDEEAKAQNEEGG